jgi:hypothetical protein
VFLRIFSLPHCVHRKDSLLNCELLLKRLHLGPVGRVIKLPFWCHYAVWGPPGTNTPSRIRIQGWEISSFRQPFNSSLQTEVLRAQRGSGRTEKSCVFLHLKVILNLFVSSASELEPVRTCSLFPSRPGKTCG